MTGIADWYKNLDKLDAQNFGPNDSPYVSAINHPLRAGKKLADWIARQTQTAAGIPEQYDNPNPLLAPSPNAQSQAAFDLAGLVQGGSMPFAPKSAGGTLGTLIKNGVPETEYSKAHEIAQRNAVEMLGLAPDNTAMDRAKAMGFDTDAYHGTKSDLSSINPSDDGFMGKGIYLSNDANEAAFFATRKGIDGINIIPAKIKGNLTEWDVDDYRHQKLQNLDIVNNGYDGAYKDFNKINTEYNIFDPKNIRSRFAAFDPAKKDSADLLASKLLPATMLGYGMANQRSLSDYFGAQ